MGGVYVYTINIFMYIDILLIVGALAQGSWHFWLKGMRCNQAEVDVPGSGPLDPTFMSIIPG